jgi:hypothetical protein
MIARTDKLRYYENIATAFELSMNATTEIIRINSFYSSNIIHSVALAANLASNVILQSFGGNHTITVINAPLP